MKVLFVSSSLAPKYGGPSLSESGLAAGLAQYCQVNVICPTARFDEGFARGQGLHGARGFNQADVLAAATGRKHWLAELIRKSDMIHLNGHWQWEYFWLVRLARKYGVSYVVHPRGMCWVGHRKKNLKKAFNLLIGNFVLRNASRVIMLSHYEARHLTRYRIDPSRIEVIPNGIGGPINLSTPDSKRDFLYFGRLEKRKNLEFLIQAFALYRERGGKEALNLMGPVEAEYDKIVRNEIVQAGVEQFVHFQQPVYGEDKWAVLSGAKAVFYPAKEEAFGRVPFEALAVGTLPVVPSGSGAAEYLLPVLPVAIYKEPTAECLAQKMREIDSDASVDVQPGVQMVLNDLSWEKVTKKMYSVYQSILVETYDRVDSLSKSFRRASGN